MAKKKVGRPPGPRTPAEIAADKNRTGRPPKKQAERQQSRFSVNLTEWELDGIKACAEWAGLSLSGYLVGLWRESGDFEKWRTSIRPSKQK